MTPTVAAASEGSRISNLYMMYNILKKKLSAEHRQMLGSFVVALALFMYQCFV